MNALAKMLGVPTFPLSDGMYLKKRTPEEYQYLINHGFLTHYYRKYLIRKHNNVYQLLRNNAPEPELEAEAPTLEALIMLNNLPIAQFQWHVNWIDDNDPTYPLQAEEDTLDTGELEALAHIQELEPA